MDEILSEFDTWCKCGHNECTEFGNFREAKQALNHHYHQKFLDMLPEKRHIEPDYTVLGEAKEENEQDKGYNSAIEDMEAKLKLLRSESDE